MSILKYAVIFVAAVIAGMFMFFRRKKDGSNRKA